MTILKLANAGDEATLDITGAEIVTGQYGEQVQFDAGEDRLYLPLSSAERQLERLGLANGKNIDFGSIIGQRLVFSRTASPKPGVNYWNINTAKPKTNGAPPVAKTNEKKPVSLSSKPQSELPEFLRDQESQDKAELDAKLAGVDTSVLEKRLAVYEALTDWWLSTIAPKYVKSDIGCSPESGVAGVATLFMDSGGK
jgi:hypothetical protein